MVAWEFDRQPTELRGGMQRNTFRTDDATDPRRWIVVPVRRLAPLVPHRGRTRSGLRRLDLEDNSISGREVARLVAAASHLRLNDLNLGHARLGPGGAAALAAAPIWRLWTSWHSSPATSATRAYGHWRGRHTWPVCASCGCVTMASLSLASPPWGKRRSGRALSDFPSTTRASTTRRSRPWQIHQFSPISSCGTPMSGRRGGGHWAGSHSLGWRISTSTTSRWETREWRRCCPAPACPV
jgi:hypothetical protein